MSDEPPALLDRIAGHLGRAAGPIPVERLARTMLGLRGPGSGEAGRRILEPLLREDERFFETRAGWCLSPEGGVAAGPGSPETRGPFAALGLVASSGTPPSLSVCLVSYSAEGDEGPVLHEASGPASLDGSRESGVEVAGLAMIVSRRGAPDLRAAGVAAGGMLTLPLGRLARAVAGTPARAELATLAARLGLLHRVEEGARGQARLAAAVWLEVRERLAEEDLLGPEDLDRLIRPPSEPGEVEGRLDPALLLELPEGPGVYRFLDGDGRPLYVGKSVNLRARVLSYFTGPPRDGKDRRLRDEALDLRVESLGSEPEALLREQELIRRHRPPLNTQLAVAERQVATDDRVLVLPGRTARSRTLLLLRGGRLAETLSVGLRREGRRRALEALGRIYFEACTGLDDARAEEGGHLLASWLRRHPHRVLSFDPGAVGGRERAEDLLLRYLETDPHEGPVFLME